MDPKSFIKGRSRETKIMRNAQGKWFLEGDPIAHENLTQAFHQWVDIAEDGRYCLKNDINWAYVEIQGAPFIVQKVRWNEDGHATLYLAGNIKEKLDPSTLRQDKKNQIYCSIRGGKLSAQFDRYATAQLAEKLMEDEKGLFFEIEDEKWRPPIVSEPLLEKKKHESQT